MDEVGNVARRREVLVLVPTLGVAEEATEVVTHLQELVVDIMCIIGTMRNERQQGLCTLQKPGDTA